MPMTAIALSLCGVQMLSRNSRAIGRLFVEPCPAMWASAQSQEMIGKRGASMALSNLETNAQALALNKYLDFVIPRSFLAKSLQPLFLILRFCCLATLNFVWQKLPLKEILNTLPSSTSSFILVLLSMSWFTSPPTMSY